MEPEYFNLEVVTKSFERSLKEDDDIFLDDYLIAYKEYNKFFHCLGTVFSFVSSDVTNKIAILEDFRLNDDNSDKFETFKSMMDYEKSGELFKNNRYVSGSRTLLRLHRGLEFIQLFLLKLSELSGADKTTASCQTAYNETLAKHHPWVIRKGALVAMYALPIQEQLLNKVCCDVPKAVEMLPKMLEITRNVYDRTHKLYTDFDLHALP